MLAQNFKTMEELGIKHKEEYEALVKTLAFLERGECTYVVCDDQSLGMHGIQQFNMAHWECGSCRCILGWARHFAGKNKIGENFFNFLPGNLWSVCYPSLDRSDSKITILPNLHLHEITVEQAAHALRNYLTTGKPSWDEVVRNGMDPVTE